MDARNTLENIEKLDQAKSQTTFLEIGLSPGGVEMLDVYICKLQKQMKQDMVDQKTENNPEQQTLATAGTAATSKPKSLLAKLGLNRAKPQPLLHSEPNVAPQSNSFSKKTN